jgi:pimeloyl-ACP methyl ester carboxylesterase
MGRLPEKVELHLPDLDQRMDQGNEQVIEIPRRHQNVPSFYRENLGLHELEAMDAAVLNMQDTLRQRGVAEDKIEAISPIGYRVSTLEDGSKKEHLLLAVEHNEFTERIWRSAPAAGKAVPGSPIIVTKPGLGERVEDGIGWHFHEAMAIENPETTVITHASHSSQGTDAMAQACLELLQIYFPSEKFLFVGTSMGSKIMTTMLAKNQQLPNEERINIEGFTLFSSAVVRPGRVPIDMGARFMGGMVMGLGKQVLFRTKKEDRAEYLRMLMDSRLSLEEVRGAGRHIIDLMKGSPRNEIEMVAHYYRDRMMVISGSEDSLRQSRMWRSLGVTYIPIKGKAHETAVDPVVAAKKITKEMRKSGWLMSDFALAA